MPRQQSIIMTYLFSIAGGILLTIFHGRESLFEGIVISAGVLFMLPCVYMLMALIWSYIASSTFEKGNANYREMKSLRGMLLLPVLGGLGFGILLVSAPNFFVHYIIYTFAVILIIVGIVQTFFLIPGIRYIDVSAWWIIVPLLTIVAGVAIFVVGAKAVSSGVALFAGIWLICSGVNGIISFIHREGKLRQQQLLRG